MKGKLKNVLLITCGFILGIGVCVGAVVIYDAANIKFSPSDTTWNVTNVEEAINDIKNNYVSKSAFTDLNLIWEYNYTGSNQTFTAPIDGIYKVELWGASGGDSLTYTSAGGNGAYVAGEVNVKKGTNLYVYVGGKGSATPSQTEVYVAGGFNGGGSTNGQACCSRSFGSGGGSTDIRIVDGEWNDTDSLKSRIMVAGGGGGAFGGENGGSIYNPGGAGGILVGLSGTQSSNGSYCYGLGGSQSEGGRITTDCTQSSTFSNAVTGGFGYGGSGSAATGGGGGYYGGSRSGHIASAGGGSSYVKGCTGCDTTYTSYQGDYEINNIVMTAGNTTMPTHDGSSTMTGNDGNGYAKITLVSAS